MKGLRNILTAACSLVLLANCASQDEIRRLNHQLRTVNQKVKTVESRTEERLQEVASKAEEKALKGKASSSYQIESMAEEARELRAINQEHEERFSRYKAETEEKIASLYAAIEQIQAENTHLGRYNEELVQSLELRIGQLTESLELTSQEQVQAASQRVREAEERAREAAERAAAARRQAELALSSANTVHMSAGARAEEVVLQPETRKVRRSNESVRDEEPLRRQEQEQRPASDMLLFDQAMQRFRDKEYKTAYKIFDQVLASQLGEEQAAQTLYLMGECLFNQGEYDLAILDYQKVISNYSKDPHSAAALLRQGMSFEKLRDNETAKLIYTKLTIDHPNSREAAVARERINDL
jgi:TolA-binding protein